MYKDQFALDTWTVRTAFQDVAMLLEDAGEGFAVCEQYAKAFEEGDAEDSNDEEANCRKVMGVSKGEKKLKVAGASERKPDAPSHGKYVPHLYNEKRLAFIAASEKPRKEAQALWLASSECHNLLAPLAVGELIRRRFVPKGTTSNPFTAKATAALGGA